MMQIFIPKETTLDEMRVPILPQSVEKLRQMGGNVSVEKGIGHSIHVSDEAYLKAGARVLDHRVKAIKEADLILRLHAPSSKEVELMKPGSIHISFMDPFSSHELVRTFADAQVSAISMEMIPRITVAQKMDALSSQASLAGYVAVILGAQHLQKIFPLMMTPAGTIHPSKVFIIGAGVAGLQAIATAKRLGAQVDAFDTRPVVEEQVRSLGAKFVKIDLGELSQTDQGYAKELTSKQLKMQQEGMAQVCEKSDLVITTAQVFGRRAPLIITEKMVKRMKPGSVLVDLAVESGGNVEGSIPGEIVEIEGVHIIGYRNLPSHVSLHASEMYSNNITNLVEHFWNKKESTFKLNLDDEIIQKSLITHNGEIINTKIQQVV